MCHTLNEREKLILTYFILNPDHSVGKTLGDSLLHSFADRTFIGKNFGKNFRVRTFLSLQLVGEGSEDTKKGGKITSPEGSVVLKTYFRSKEKFL